MRKFKIILGTLLVGTFVSAYADSASQSGGTDIQNTRSFSNSPINNKNVNQIQQKWEYLTVPDTGTPNTAFGAVSSTPAVDGDYIYFNDQSGNITKLNRYTGALVWKKNYVNDLSIPNFTVTASRNTPYIANGLVVVGSNFNLTDQYCKTVNKPPQALVCNAGEGAIVLALDAKTGNVVWRQKVDPHPSSKITGSISGYNNVLYVPVGNWEEEFARTYPNIFPDPAHPDVPGAPTDPNSAYPCCSARGSLVALDLSTGNKIWQTYTVIGNDPDNQLPANLKALLTPKGFFGSSTYGHNPVIDPKRNQVYIATAQTTTAPKVAEDCAKARIATGNPNANISGLPSGVTCNNLNQKLKTYANAMLALDMKTGAVKWAFYAHQYDAWNHACAASNFGGMGSTDPVVFPVPIANTTNCFQNPIGPDNGFGQQPMLVTNVKMPNGYLQDLVIAGNKDGRLFAVNPDTGQKIWETDTDPGSLYGGLQFGRATDGKNIYFGTFNGRNQGRNVNTKFASNDSFLQINGFSALGVKPTPFYKRDGDTPKPTPAPSDLVLPFPGPNIVYGITSYPDVYPDANVLPPYLKGPASGPSEKWTLINPPSDVVADGLTVFNSGNQLTTIDGMIQAVDAATGKIRWQRPANDAISGTLAPTGAHGTLTVGNNVVFIGYADSQGTLVALDANTGKKLYQFQNTIKLSDGSSLPSGGFEGGPLVVGDWIYMGAGLETLGLFPNGQFLFRNNGNRVYGFQLPKTCY
ncbi:MAG: PQQ-binding-like beta-propeller repeat protein [Proteobacteria bacterium]|nr:PQQ-binding-like beta-propeller repeat protein [Pseudomonadota bacterium]